MQKPIAISIAGLTALCWILTAIAFLVTAGRFTIRFKVSRSFIASDYINGVACILLIAFMAMYTRYLPLYYELESYAVGQDVEPDPDIVIVYFKTEAAISMLFWIIMYLVKASFLMLYRFLFGISARFMQIWWGVTAITIVCFLISFISTLWECGNNPARDLFQPTHCLTLESWQASIDVVKLWCALNVFSDLLIILLPVYMIRKLKMSLLTKLGLALIFTVALIDVMFDIIRTIYILIDGPVAMDIVWDVLEPPVAVIVCSLPIYRQAWALFQNRPTTPSDPSPTQPSPPPSKTYSPRDSEKTLVHSPHSTEYHKSREGLDTITVKFTVDVSEVFPQRPTDHV